MAKLNTGTSNLQSRKNMAFCGFCIPQVGRLSSVTWTSQLRLGRLSRAVGRLTCRHPKNQISVYSALLRLDGSVLHLDVSPSDWDGSADGLDGSIPWYRDDNILNLKSAQSWTSQRWSWTAQSRAKHAGCAETILKQAILQSNHFNTLLNLNWPFYQEFFNQNLSLISIKAHCIVNQSWSMK
jgi:hypothetical protein